MDLLSDLIHLESAVVDGASPGDTPGRLQPVPPWMSAKGPSVPPKTFSPDRFPSADEDASVPPLASADHPFQETQFTAPQSDERSPQSVAVSSRTFDDSREASLPLPGPTNGPQITQFLPKKEAPDQRTPVIQSPHSDELQTAADSPVDGHHSFSETLDLNLPDRRSSAASLVPGFSAPDNHGLEANQQTTGRIPASPGTISAEPDARQTAQFRPAVSTVVENPQDAAKPSLQNTRSSDRVPADVAPHDKSPAISSQGLQPATPWLPDAPPLATDFLPGQISAAGSGILPAQLRTQVIRETYFSEPAASVHVSIGRLEIRAALPTAVTAKETRPGLPPSAGGHVSDYLRRRSGANHR
jgi:hypothetical protein